MKLLYLVPRIGPHGWETKMSQVRRHQVLAIARDSRVRVRVSGPGWGDWDEKLTAADNARRLDVAGEPADLVLVYKVDGLAGCPVPVAVAYNEAYAYDRVNAEVEALGARLVIFHHAADLPRYAHWERAGVVRAHLPHCAEMRVYADWGEAKMTDVLVAGNLQHVAYPFRARLARLAIRYFAKRGYRVKVLAHPGYTLPAREGTLTGEAFSREINRAKVVFTCSMRHKYQLAKYAEIALSRALPVGDLPDECEPCTRRLEQMILRVEPWQTDEDICRAVEDVLDDSERLRTLTDRARELALRELTMGQYADRFIDVAEAFLRGRPAPRRSMRPGAPPGTRVVYAYAAETPTPAEAEFLTPDATYTVEATAPASVAFRELPGLRFPVTLFREEAG